MAPAYTLLTGAHITHDQSNSTRTHWVWSLWILWYQHGRQLSGTRQKPATLELALTQWCDFTDHFLGKTTRRPKYQWSRSHNALSSSIPNGSTSRSFICHLLWMIKLHHYLLVAPQIHLEATSELLPPVRDLYTTPTLPPHMPHRLFTERA